MKLTVEQREAAEKKPALLSVPRVDRAHFARNFIQQAVCEFRFPTLFELDADKPPAKFAASLRKQYPLWTLQHSLKVGPGAPGMAPRAHQFKSKNERWIVTLRTSSIAVETSSYDSFEEFRDRVSAILAAAKEMIDTEFFTRIGLRYINAIPCTLDDVSDWVNPELVGPLGARVYGDVMEFSQRVAGKTASGDYLFNHAMGENLSKDQAYILDFDFSQYDVEFGDALKTLDELHSLEFDMFTWALGPRAREFLGPSTK